MSKSLDITGQKFNMLTALYQVESKGEKTYWMCQCDCGNKKEVQTSHLKNGTIKSCGCLKDKYKKPLKEAFCENCGKKLKKGQYKFCCNQCQRDLDYKNYIEDWKNNKVSGTKKCGKKNKLSDHVRRYLFEKNKSKCELCGWGEINLSTGKVPLEIHHKDGKKENNAESNLELLCPNCHSLTPNYKYLNSKKYKKAHEKDNKNSQNVIVIS